VNRVEELSPGLGSPRAHFGDDRTFLREEESLYQASTVYSAIWNSILRASVTR